MARSFLTPINLNKLELQNAAIQNLGTAPSSPVKGQMYFNSTGGDNTLYWYDGTTWVAAKAGSGVSPATTVTTEAVGNAAVVGTSLNYARQDHVHGREAFGASTAVTTFGAAKADGTAVTVSHSDHTHGSPAHDAAAHSLIPISALAPASANVSMGGNILSGVATPVSGTDAANKNYVDGAVAGLAWKDSVRLASTANVAFPPTGLAAIDGVTPVAGDRILLKAQTNAAENVIWIASATTWIISPDVDSQAKLLGAAVFVEEGTTNADTSWVMTTNAPITVLSTPLTWAQFAGGGSVTAGAGMTQAGNVLNVIAGDATLTVAADSIVRAALTGDVTTVVNAATIAANAVTNTKLADMPTLTIKGNNTGATADPIDMTVPQLVTMLGTSILRKQNTTVGTGASLVYIINHSLATQQVMVQVRRTTAPFDVVDCDIEIDTASSITLRFAVSPGVAEYYVMIVG